MDRFWFLAQESGESNLGYLFMLVHAGRFSQARQEVHIWGFGVDPASVER